ncbi:MAG: NAD-dependent epimerase/dehydratase family protein [Oligoflexia bacterium]|nr:NAD-dependent epimerase/dehydratase family protein [Oligoflexia bacterium]
MSELTSIKTRVLITGGGGFLATAIIRMLAKEHPEFELFSISRNYYSHLESIEGIEGEKVSVRQIGGDISDLSFMQKIFKEYRFDVVFHVAAFASMWGPWKDFERVNILGTKNIIQVMKEFNVPKLIYTSSPSAVFGYCDLEGVDEENAPYPTKFHSYYAKSKAAAEKLVLAANDGKNLLTVALRPHLIWGPGDKHLIPRVLKMARSGRLKIVGDGKNLVDITYVDNAAYAHLLAYRALESASAPSSSKVLGRAYFIADEKPVVLWDFINKILSLNGITPLSLEKRVPFKLAYKAGAVAEFSYKYFVNGLLRIKREPPMTRYVVMMLAKSHYFNHKRSQDDFGYRPIVDHSEGLSRMI